MFARIAIASLLVSCAICAQAPAGVIEVSVVNLSPDASSGGVTQTQSSVQSPSTAGTLEFSMTTSAPSELDPLSFGSVSYDLFEYGGLNANVTNPNGTIINATVENYDLSISLVDADLGNLGTIDLVGDGKGGTRTEPGVMPSNPADDTFINDELSSLRVNGRTLFPGFTFVVAQFALRYGSDQFLNISLINPNPDGDDGNFREGLRLDMSVSKGSPDFGFQLIDEAPTQQRSAVPEPASWTAFAFAVVAVGLVGLRRRTQALAAPRANAVG